MPFRFVDEILELSEDHACGAYRFREDEYFYAGHFPGNPVTPGVVLIETMAQIGLVPLALFLGSREQPRENANAPVLTLFTEAEVEFSAPVLPGDRVVVRSKKIYFRRNKLKCEVAMFVQNDAKADLDQIQERYVAGGTLAGFGVRQ